MNFDSFAQGYVTEVDKVARVSVERLAGEKARLLLDVLRVHLGDPKELRVLDIGCGIRLVDRVHHADVGLLWGVDLIRESLYCAKILAPATRFGACAGVNLARPQAR